MVSNIHDFLPSSTTCLGVIDLLKYDHDMTLLFKQIQKYKKEHYEPGEKIIVVHNDTEYFYPGSRLGFTTHNLFSIWRYLDIPYSVMVLIHNHHGIDRGIDFFITDQRDSPVILNNIVNQYSIGHLKSWLHGQTPIKNIKHFAMCLMSTPRSHRIALMQYLKHHDMLDKVKTNFSVGEKKYNLTSYSLKDSKLNVATSDQVPHGLVYSQPFRINENCFSQSRYQEIKKISSLQVDPHEDSALNNSFDDFYHNFFIDIVTETVFDYPHVFVSEKTLRPLLLKTPFVLFAAAGTLEHLREHGFKTFSNFWDESYDCVQDPHLRFLMCCDVIKKLMSKTIHELNTMYQDIMPILEHNRATLIDYINNQFVPLYQKIGLVTTIDSIPYNRTREIDSDN